MKTFRNVHHPILYEDAHYGMSLCVNLAGL